MISRSVDRDRREGEIVIDGTILRSVDCDLAKHRADRDQREGEFAISDRDRRLVLANGANWSLDVRTASTGSLSPSCTLALSLSLSLEFI